MKKQFLLFASILIAMAVTMSSCKDDETDNGDGGTASLTSGSWKISGLTIDPPINIGGVSFSDFYAQMPACVKDDIITFNSDGTMTTDEGATKCDPSDPQTTSGTWSYSGSTLTINDPDGNLETMNVTELTSSTLRGNFTVTDDFGNGVQEYTMTVTLSKN